MAEWLRYRNGEPMLYAGQMSEMPYETFCIYEYCLDAAQAAEGPGSEEALMRNLDAHQARLNRALQNEGWGS